MDPINPVADNPEAVNQTPVSQSPKIKNPLVLILSILLIIAVAIAGLFYFQIQKLSRELSKYQTQPTPTPTATSDPTANWETYNSPLTYGENFWFSFKYPNSIRTGGYGSIPGPFTEKYTSLGGLSDPTVLKESTNASFDGFAIYGVVNEADGIEKHVDNEIAAMSKSELASNNNLIKTPLVLTGIKGYSVDFSPTLKYYYISSPDGKNIVVISRVCANQSFLTIFDQILSTFKFLDEEDPWLFNSRDLRQGWYWGSIDQKKPGTPDNWIFSGNGSRSDCWHEPNTTCTFLPNQ